MHWKFSAEVKTEVKREMGDKEGKKSMIPFHGGKDTHRLIRRYANVIWWRCPLLWSERLTTTFPPRTPPINLTLTCLTLMCVSLCQWIPAYQQTRPPALIISHTWAEFPSTPKKTKQRFPLQQLQHLHGVWRRGLVRRLQRLLPTHMGVAVRPNQQITATPF